MAIGSSSGTDTRPRTLNSSRHTSSALEVQYEKTQTCSVSLGKAEHKVKLAYLVSHPIQYQTPLLRRIAQDPDIDLTVFFGSDFSTRGYRDEGFGVDLKWDTPQLDGYKYEVLPALRDNGTEGMFSPISRGLLQRLAGGPTSEPFDVLWVHGYATMNQMHGILAAKALGIPVLVRSDSSLRDRPRGGAKLVLKRVFFWALHHLIDGVLVSGTLNREYWTEYFGSRVPQFLLPYAVDNEWFQARCAEAAATRHMLLAELNLESSRPVILFASKLQTRKHCNDLIAAYAKMAVDGNDPHPYLVIVGDGEERAALEAQAKATGMMSIRFCGFRNQSELPRFFDLATVFVLPSRHEPWGLIVNEVMNAAKPIIVTDDVGCQPDLVREGLEGCVYPARDVDALHAALVRVLEVPDAANAMGERALQRVNAWNFDEDVRGLRQAVAHVTGKMNIQESAC